MTGNQKKNSSSNVSASVGQLWTNHGRCKEIRSKMAAHQASVKEQWQAAGKFDTTDKKILKDLNRKLQKIQGGITIALKFTTSNNGRFKRKSASVAAVLPSKMEQIKLLTSNTLWATETKLKCAVLFTFSHNTINGDDVWSLSLL